MWRPSRILESRTEPVQRARSWQRPAFCGSSCSSCEPRRCSSPAAEPLRLAQAGLTLAGLVLLASVGAQRRHRKRLRRLRRLAGGIGQNTCPESCVALLPMRLAAVRTPLVVLDDALRMDPYRVLSIPFLATREKIREAYAQVCKSHHPDLHQGRQSMEWMMAEWAYGLLMDPEERARYDTSRVVRNALSLTEGVFAFGLAAAQQLGQFMSDVVEVTKKVTVDFFSPSLLANGSEVAEDKRKEELKRIKVQRALDDFLQAQRDLKERRGGEAVGEAV
eukprot:gb/GFBE01071980.1/.p1 GENE.gb/GFBE01071980.1/~~gb/GFBE01071980.1/.p1  ORF type:complete len:277 (+),score=54.91 gb/GFBE01071980.1/:1-831(+)